MKSPRETSESQGPAIPIWRTASALPDRLPPHNLEAEQSCLGSILIDGAMMAAVAELVDVADFYRDIHQVIFQAMKDLWEEGSPIDAITLADRLISQKAFDQVSGDETLRELIDAVPHQVNAAYYAGIVRSKAKTRHLIDVMTEGIHRAYSNELTAEELLDLVARRISTVKCDDDRKDDNTIHPAPDRMGEKAFHGLTGEIVRIVNPQTEACPEAILAQFLVAFGQLIGPRPHWGVDRTVHRCNLFVCLVGPTGIARKGTSWDIVRWLLCQSDPDWPDRRILGGLTSGEGLIEQIAEADGNLLAVESEFARLLTNASRDHSSLSAVIRQAWDGPLLSVPTRNNPIYCSNAYFSLIGHMTISDLRAKLCDNDLSNGMANRIVWVNVYRDGNLPEGGDFDAVSQALSPLVPDLMRAANHGQKDMAFERRVRKTPRARELWRELYEGPLSEVRTGDYAKVTVRAAPMILRIALIYAVLDRCTAIDVPHVEAAKAFWDYAEGTAAHLFGNIRDDTDLAKVIAALGGIPAGLTKGEINRKAFGGHAKAAKLDELLGQAQGAGLIARGERKTSNGSKTIWIHREVKK